MHSVLFGCLTKLSAKHLELVQKFVPGSRVGSFHNERTRSTRLDPNLTFRCVSYYLDSGPFGCLPTLGTKQAELVQKFLPRSRVEIFHNECSNPPHWTLNWCFGAFQTIWVHSGPFGCLTKLGAKWADLVQKFVPQSRVGIFHNKLCRSTPLDRKLTFWCVLYYLGAFGTVWLPYKIRCKTGRTSAKVRATKSRQNFSQRTHPINPIGL